LFCGEYFPSPGSGKKAKYCSRKCSSQSRCNGEIKKCVICDTDIYVPKNKIDGRLHFCTKEHFDEWQSRNKKSYTCCTCGKEFLESPSIKRKYCSTQCRYDNNEERQRLINLNLQLQKGKPTKLEISGYSLLDELGIKYEPQYLIANKFCVDAFVPDINLVIQFDGDYWHGNPRKYKVLDKRQERRSKLDQSQDAYLVKCGFKVLRIWESDMKSNKTSVITAIESYEKDNVYS
jgi:very-short-patch-repair endonuclease